MQDHAVGYDSSDASPNRRSVWAYAITGLGLLGTIAAIVLIANGRDHAAESLATITFLVVILYESLTSLVGPQRVSDKERSILSQGAGLGSFAALLFLGICYWIGTWPLTEDAPVVFSRSELSAAFWIVLSMIQSVPRAYYLWSTRSAMRR